MNFRRIYYEHEGYIQAIIVFGTLLILLAVLLIPRILDTRAGPARESMGTILSSSLHPGTFVDRPYRRLLVELPDGETFFADVSTTYGGTVGQQVVVLVQPMESGDVQYYLGSMGQQ